MKAMIRHKHRVRQRTQDRSSASPPEPPPAPPAPPSDSPLGGYYGSSSKCCGRCGIWVDSWANAGLCASCYDIVQEQIQTERLHTQKRSEWGALAHQLAVPQLNVTDKQLAAGVAVLEDTAGSGLTPVDRLRKILEAMKSAV